MEIINLSINVAIDYLQISNCNSMTQRYVDISNLSILIIMEIIIGVYFVITVRNNRSSTWTKTRIEVIIKVILELIDICNNNWGRLQSLVQDWHQSNSQIKISG